jgi:hypothetical protein
MKEFPSARRMTSTTAQRKGPALDALSSGGPDGVKTETHDRHSLVLLVSLLFFLVLSAFVRDDWISEVVLVLSMYSTLIIAILKISEKRDMPWPALRWHPSPCWSRLLVSSVRFTPFGSRTGCSCAPFLAIRPSLFSRFCCSVGRTNHAED